MNHSSEAHSDNLCEQCRTNVAPFKVGNLPFYNAYSLNRCSDCLIKNALDARKK